MRKGAARLKLVGSHVWVAVISITRAVAMSGFAARSIGGPLRYNFAALPSRPRACNQRWQPANDSASAEPPRILEPCFLPKSELALGRSNGLCVAQDYKSGPQTGGDIRATGNLDSRAMPRFEPTSCRSDTGVPTSAPGAPPPVGTTTPSFTQTGERPGFLLAKERAYPGCSSA